MQDTEYSPEPRSWVLPEEPPVGTVVSNGSRSWKRVENRWFDGDEIGFAYSWPDVLATAAGGVTEVLPTAAEEQAERLERLAAHLRAFPGLAQVNVGRDSLQVHGVAGREAEDLWSWALSLRDTSMKVQVLRGDAFVHITGQLGDRQEEVWDTVPGFAEYLAEEFGISPSYEPATVDVLGEFIQQQHDAQVAEEIDAAEEAAAEEPMPEPGSVVYRGGRAANVAEVDSAGRRVLLQFMSGGGDGWLPVSELDADLADGPVA